MNIFRNILAAIAVLALLTAPAPVWADQNDLRLDTLFGKLQKTENPTEVTEIVEKIWVVWTEINDQAAHGEMLQGVNAMAQQEFDAALAFFDEVIAKFPGFAEAWNKRATVFYLMGRFEESLKDVHMTLDLEPRHFGALSGQGLIHMATGDTRHAIEAFEQALEINPHMPIVRMRIKLLREELDKNAI